MRLPRWSREPPALATGSVSKRHACGGAHHHHLTCTKCHRVVEIDMCLAPESLSAVERSTDFALEGHRLELFGRCADCRAE